MRIVICSGPRDWEHRDAIQSSLRRIPDDVVIVQGGATGADAMWAESQDHQVITIKANWSLGRRAGPLRNRLMLDWSLLTTTEVRVLACRPRTGWTRGTKNLVDEALKRGVVVIAVNEYGVWGKVPWL